MQKYQKCKRCVMDTTDPQINFDDRGICNKCSKLLSILNTYPYNSTAKQKREKLLSLVNEIKQKGKFKKYDCIIGVSGGVDSTFMAMKAKELGLKPLAVHMDNGWNTELAQKNIENVLKKLEIDLYTYVLDWEEFKNIQLSFLKASTPDAEIPSDHAIIAVLNKSAEKYKLQYILTGVNLTTEGVSATAWSNGIFDWKYIKSVQQRFGTKKIKTYPHFSLFKLFYYHYFLKIKRISLLDYYDYKRDEAVKILQREINWRDYGHKHYESFYTRFFQAYILPVKFGYDKRKCHFSSLICSGQMSRKKALQELRNPLYDKNRLVEDMEYVAKKFGINTAKFKKLILLPLKNFNDYPSYQKEWYYQLFWNLNEKYKKLWKDKYFFS